MNARPTQPIPVILDTDIGDDIDDAWALALMLRSPELDLKLVVTDWGDTVGRARIVAKLLDAAERTDVPIGIGVRLSDTVGRQAPWAADYDLARYPGTVHEDGVGALIDTIMGAPKPMTLVCIGPNPNIAAALGREPRIAERARFVGMYGSIRKGYGGRRQIDAEWNVRASPADCRKVFTAPWEMTITPVDTCSLVVLRGEKYRAVRDSSDPLARALVASYRVWAQGTDYDPEVQSSVLYDTVAAYLAFREDLVVMEDLPIRVTDDGFTRVEEGAKIIRCATAWRDLGAFEDLLVVRLAGTP